MSNLTPEYILIGITIITSSIVNLFMFLTYDRIIRKMRADDVKKDEWHQEGHKQKWLAFRDELRKAHDEYARLSNEYVAHLKDEHK